MKDTTIVTSTTRYKRLAEEVIMRMEYGNQFNAGALVGKKVSAAFIEKDNPDKFAQLIKDYYADYTREVFIDGETHHVIHDFDRLAGKNVVLVGGTVDDTEFMELMDLATTIVEQAHSLTIVIPYFGYSTMERRTIPGEVVKAAKRAHLLKNIPDAEIKNTFIFFDLHTEGIPYYFGEDCRKFHVYTKPLVIEACDEIRNGREFVLGTVDTGRTKWIESLAKDMSKIYGFKVEVVIANKAHKAGTSESEMTGVQGYTNIDGKIVIIYDDMVRSGGSVANVTEAYRNMGASEVHGVFTHGVFPLIEVPGYLRSGLTTGALGLPAGTKVPSVVRLVGPFHNRLNSLYVTDTHCNAFSWDDRIPGKERVHIKSVAGLIATTVRNKTEF